MRASRQAHRNLILVGFCAIQIAGVFYYGSGFMKAGYLPSPFIYDKNDTLMDFFHPLFWADDDGRYTVWGSVYPPLNFLFLKLVRWLLIANGQSLDAFALRESLPHIGVYMIPAFLITSAFAFRADLWRGFTNTQRLLIYTSAVLSTPMLFALERGNLILFCLPFLALALTKSGYTRAFAIGILINIKPYFAILILALLLKRNLKEMIESTLTAGLIFLVSGILLDLSFLVFLENLFQFSQDAVFSGRELLSMPSSISAFAEVLRTYYGQGGNFYFENVDTLMIAGFIEKLKWTVCATALIFQSLLHRQLSTQQSLAISTVVITNLGIWVGGYSLILYIALLPIFLKMRFRSIYIVLLLLILAPLDIVTLMTDDIGAQFSYLSGTRLNVTWQLGIGTVLRPVLNFCLLLTLTAEMILRYIKLPDESSSRLNAARDSFQVPFDSARA